MDFAAGGFDARIHFGEYIEKDMIAVRVPPDLRLAIVIRAAIDGVGLAYMSEEHATVPGVNSADREPAQRASRNYR